MRKIKSVSLYLLSFGAPILIFSLIWWSSHIYPFGPISNMKDDLGYQYVELFSYLKHVMDGEAGLGYTFTKGLGGSSVALFAYYLSSPFNILLPLFSQENLQIFIFVVSALKLGMCGLTQTFFLRRRFPQLKKELVFLLSICFAASYYCVLQVENIMWMDGVYMLPLMMYGVWRLVKQKKGGALTATVFATILFNWYTAYMDCLFAVFYFGYELLKQGKKQWKEYCIECIHFCGDMILGVLLSALLFFPNVYALIQGKGGSTGGNIFSLHINGTPVNMIRGLVIGNDAGSRSLSLFCGTFVLAWFTYSLVSMYKKSRRDFTLSLLFVGIMGASLLIKPLENIWNGFRCAYSDMYRFSYLQTWLFIYLATIGLAEVNSNASKRILLSIWTVYSVLWIILDFISPFKKQMLYMTIFSMAIVSLFSPWLLHPKHVKRKVGFIAILIFTLSELCMNGVALCRAYNWGDYTKFQDYVTAQRQLLDIVKCTDEFPFYRIEQTLNRGFDKNKSSAFFLENMSFNYNGFSHYSSAFNEELRKFSELLGYGKNDTVSLYQEPILPSDSLLGIKYVFADNDYPGLVQISDVEKNGKSIYENPYVLPMGFWASENSRKMISESNHFQFQNEIYSNILGEKMEIFKPAPYRMISHTSDEISYEINLEPGHILYGYADSEIQNLKVFIDNEYRCDYEGWLTYKVFSVGQNPGNHTVRFEKFHGLSTQIHPQFYQLDLELFYNVIENIKSNSLKINTIEEGYVDAEIVSPKAGFTMLTIPMEKGWHASVNGEKVDLEKGANTLMLVPVDTGKNYIEIHYHVPYFNVGIIISIGTMLCVGMYYLYFRKNFMNK